jgi:hypothetical protein
MRRARLCWRWGCYLEHAATGKVFRWGGNCLRRAGHLGFCRFWFSERRGRDKEPEDLARRAAA